MIKALAEDIFMLVFFCIWNQNLYAFHLVFSFYFFFPLDYFHSTTISLCDYSACVTSSNLPLLFPNWEAGRHMSWRRVAGSGFASQLVSASSHVRWCQLRRFCFVSEKIFVQEGSLSFTTVLLVATSWATLLWGSGRASPCLLQILSSPAWFQAEVEKILQQPAGETGNNSSMSYIPGHIE